MPVVVVQPRHHRPGEGGHDRADALAQREARPHLPAGDGDEARGAVNRGEPEHDEHRRKHDEQSSLPAAVGHAGLNRA